MDTIIDSFHIDLKLFIAQVVNFAIVFSVLFYFVIKPLMKVMDERSKKIEDSLKQAEDIKSKLTKTEEDYEAEIKKARKEAGIIVREAGELAEKKKDEMVVQAKAEIGAIINKEKESIRTEKDKTMKELKQEVAGIVMMSLEKILEKRIDSKEDKELIKKIIDKK